jgi:hypothetical protein
VTKILTTHNAQITTAAVEVKTLTISGKQVTQSVFRQLLTEQILNEDGTLAGVPGGHVNYHPDKCADSSRAHLHVVWQLGSELRRCRVNATASFDEYGSDDRVRYPEQADAFYTACVRAWLHGDKLSNFGGNPIVCSLGYGDTKSVSQERTIRYRGVPMFSQMSTAARKAAQAWEDLARYRKKEEQEVAEGTSTHWRKNVERGEEEYAARLAELDEACADHPPLADLYASVDAEIKVEADRRQRYRASLAALTALPHLFIAV